MREIYLDIETQRWSDEVPGGWSNIPGFGLAVAVTWEAGLEFTFWFEGEDRKGGQELINYLDSYEHVITFNGERFDFKVLSAYGNVAGLYAKSFDILAFLEKELGHRVSLESLSRATLGRGKTGDGKDAVAWFRSGNKVMQEQVLWYCKNDVELLRDLVAYGRKHGELWFQDKQGGRKNILVNCSMVPWIATPSDIIAVGNIKMIPVSMWIPKKRLILTVGLPQSGKSTWARQQGHPVVSRNAIRLALHGQAYIQEREDEVTVIEDCMVKALFLAGHDTVIVDACHTTAKRRERWQDTGDWLIEEKVFSVGAEICSRRAVLNGRFDLLEAIEQMAAATDIQEIREAEPVCEPYSTTEERIED